MNYFAGLLVPLALGAGAAPGTTAAHTAWWVTPVSASYQTLRASTLDAPPSNATGLGASASGSPGAAPGPGNGSTGATGGAGTTGSGTTGTTGSGVAPGVGGGTESSSDLAMAQQMITLINQARIADGLAPYTVNSTLMSIAAERAQVLATSGEFTDDLPGLGLPLQQEEAEGIVASGMGAENIAEASTVTEAFALLMASAPHEENILNPNETQIGVGVYPVPNGIAISELFIGPNV